MLHAGLDNASAHVRQLWPDADVQVVDFYDPATMTEPAITRARGGAPEDDKIEDLRSGLDAAFVVLAAHELRTRTDRAAFFSRVAKALKPAGQLILVEHLRDLPNAFVYGPGAWHFLPRADYLTAFEDARLGVREEHAITPFLRLWVLNRSTGAVRSRIGAMLRPQPLARVRCAGCSGIRSGCFGSRGSTSASTSAGWSSSG